VFYNIDLTFIHISTAIPESLLVVLATKYRTRLYFKHNSQKTLTVSLVIHCKHTKPQARIKK